MRTNIQHSNRYQHFALDMNGSLIEIHRVNEGQQYFCPHCHKEMISKCGKIRQWHFAHKTDKCSYDKYLHSIAEMMIKDWFNKNESIMLIMDAWEKCNMYDECKFRHEYDCKRKATKQINLKKYYSICEKEQGFGGFVADLLCKNPQRLDDPIFIEILVTHECSQEKKNSGIRIIEIEIQSEEDILNIVHSSQIAEGDTVHLYNFNPKDTLVTDIGLPFLKYVLFRSKKSYVDIFNYTCRNYDQHRRGIYEISMPLDKCGHFSKSLYVIGKAKAHVEGYLPKDCQLCKWKSVDLSGGSFCKLYKKCGNPKYCKDNNAAQCSMFREDWGIINRAKSDFNEYAKNNPIDIWKENLLETQ